MTEGTDEGASEQGKAMKRRGILAAAGAVVAGLVAKQATQPVAALDPNDLALGTSNSTSAITTMQYTGGSLLTQNILTVADGTDLSSMHASAVAGYANGGHVLTGVYGTTNGDAGIGAGVYGLSTSPFSPGVTGENTSTTFDPTADGVYGKSVSGYGISGKSASSAGVYGYSDGFHSIFGDLIGTGVTRNNTAGMAGVFGNGNGTGTFGVLGEGYGGNGIGVQGQNIGGLGIGVKGITPYGFPVVGSVEGAGSGTNAHAAVTGFGTAGPGVQGQSPSGYGLVGFTNAADGHAGLIGYANQAGGIGLIGNAPGGASPGLAGVFNGDVIVNGALRVYGSPKNAAVKNPTDNSYRLLYCEESPESWFADYGEAKLANGKADVQLDPTFAALIHADTYHVFLTSHDPDSKGLAIAGRRPDGFTVQEHAGGTSGGTFSYRVVAKRKDIVGERLAKAPPPPPLKPVTPFTVPESPVPKPPTKKP